MFLFGRRQKPQAEETTHFEVEEVVEPKGAVVIPFPTASIPSRLVELQKQRSYEEVAQSIGFLPAELVLAQLLEFFEKEGMILYDFEQVEAWLTMKRTEAKADFWCWRPLREKDIIVGYYWGTDDEEKKWHDGFYCSTEKSWVCRPYARLVPLHALEKVAKIEERFGDNVKFFVSDFNDPNADPFIMVRPAACDDGGDDYHLIFDVWNEPGFGD